MHAETDPENRLTHLAEVYRTHGNLVRWVVRSRGVPDASLEDVVHDVFLAIHRRWRSRDAKLSLRTWIISIARNAAFIERRSLARRDRRNREFQETFDLRSLDRQMEARRALRVLQRFIDALPAAQAEVFVLSEIHGISSPEVASSLGCSVNTVYSRLRLARRSFARRFGEIPDRDYETLLQEVERASKPSREQQQRHWALVVAKLSATSAMPSLGWIGGGLAAAAVSVCLAIPTLGGSVDRSRREESRQPMKGSVQAQVTSPNAFAVTNTPSSTSGLPILPAEPPLFPLRAQKHAAPAHSTTRRMSRPSQTSVARTTSSRSGPEKHPSSPSETSEAADVVHETLLLRRAKAELARGRVKNAFVHLRAHERAFKDGALVLERLRLTIDGWCMNDRPDRAKETAALLASMASHRLPGRSLEDPCSGAKRSDGSPGVAVPKDL